MEYKGKAQLFIRDKQVDGEMLKIKTALNSLYQKQA